METRTGWRATPPALLLAFSGWIVFAIVRMIWMADIGTLRIYSPRMVLVSEGVGFAAMVLSIVGVAELARRATALRRRALTVTLVGAWLVLANDLINTASSFSNNRHEHLWLFSVTTFVGITAWLLFAGGLVAATHRSRRGIAFGMLAIVAVTWLPNPIHVPLMNALGVDGKAEIFVGSGMRIARLAALLVLAILGSSGVTTADPVGAANGLRLAARGLWLRVIAAVCMVLFTLVLVGGKGGDDSISFLKMMTMAQGVVGVIALCCVGVGALRAARSGIDDLAPTVLTLGGSASLWAAGVTLAQLPFLHKMLYRNSESLYLRSDVMEWTQTLSIATPLIVIVGVGILATALSGYGARRGNEELRASAQARGVGFVALMLISVGIQTWMLPKATSAGNFALVSLLAAAAGLWATVMMAKLLTRGAEWLEQEPGLPPAAVVNDPPAS